MAGSTNSNLHMKNVKILLGNSFESVTRCFIKFKTKTEGGGGWEEEEEQRRRKKKKTEDQNETKIESFASRPENTANLKTSSCRSDVEKYRFFLLPLSVFLFFLFVFSPDFSQPQNDSEK